MEFMNVFHSVLTVPQVSSPEEVKKVMEDIKLVDDARQNTTVIEKAAKAFSKPISIKKLIMLIEMTKQGDPTHILERFNHFLLDAV